MKQQVSDHDTVRTYSPYRRIARPMFVLIAAAVLMVWFTRFSPWGVFRGHINSANRYYAAHLYKRAIAEYSAAITTQPTNYTGYFLRAMGYYRSRDYKSAIADDTKVLTMNPSRAVVSTTYFNRGLSYAAGRDLKQATEDFSDCLARSPKNTDALINRADCYRQTGRPSDAINDANAFLKLTKPTYFAYLVRGLANMELNKWQDSVSDLALATRLKKDAPQAWFSLGWAQYKSGDLQHAMESDKRAIEMQPNAPVGHFNLGLCLAQLGDSASAQAEYTLGLSFADENGVSAALEDIRSARKQTAVSDPLKKAEDTLQKRQFILAGLKK